MTIHLELFLALLVLLGIMSQWLAWRLKLPAILLLLLIGLVAGPVTGIIRPDDFLGDLLFPFVSFGVAVILFEGSLTLKLDEIRGHGSMVSNLVTLGVAITWVIVSVAAWLLLDISPQVAFLFGALMTVTGPTVIVPMLRTVRPTASVANILRWEGILVDPLGALLAVLVFEFIASGRQEGHTALIFAKELLTGGVIGGAGAWLLAEMLGRHWLPDYLHNVMTLALVLVIFTGANALEHESGLIAVTVMGMMLANMRRELPTERILDFKESLSILLISLLFIVLAARLQLEQVRETVNLNALAVLAIIIVFARPLAVWCSSIGSGLRWQEKVLIAWIGPRGIVAASVSALFALRLEGAGYADARHLVPLTFMVIVGTVVLQSLTARPLARWLGLAEPDPRGILIVGGNRLARVIAGALKELGFHTLLADDDWEHVRAARLGGLDTYFGNVVSQHADRTLNLSGIGSMFALSRRPNLNALSCVRYRAEFGVGSVFFLPTPREEQAAEPEKRRITVRYSGRRLFAEDATFDKLAELLDEGGEIRTTPLTKEFTFADYQNFYGADAVPLFAVDEKESLQVFTADEKLLPKPGWSVVSLLSRQALDEVAKQRAAKTEMLSTNP
jgi:CPA1 family monovalent cation:H+ antiporter